MCNSDPPNDAGSLYPATSLLIVEFKLVLYRSNPFHEFFMQPPFIFRVYCTKGAKCVLKVTGQEIVREFDDLLERVMHFGGRES